MGTEDKMLGGNLRWTSIPSRGSSNTSHLCYKNWDKLRQCRPVIGPSAASTDTQSNSSTNQAANLLTNVK